MVSRDGQTPFVGPWNALICRVRAYGDKNIETCFSSFVGYF
jgi:hypothetical protein